MPNKLSINYLPSFLPLTIVGIIFFSALLSVLIVPLPPMLLFGLFFLLFFVLCECAQWHQHLAKGIICQHKKWYVLLPENKQIEVVIDRYFVSSFCVLLVFESADKQQYPFYFTRYRCDEYGYRFLCAHFSSVN